MSVIEHNSPVRPSQDRVCRYWDREAEAWRYFIDAEGSGVHPAAIGDGWSVRFPHPDFTRPFLEVGQCLAFLDEQARRHPDRRTGSSPWRKFADGVRARVDRAFDADARAEPSPGDDGPHFESAGSVKFAPGEVVVKEHAAEAIARAGITAEDLVARHTRGDWGECETDPTITRDSDNQLEMYRESVEHLRGLPIQATYTYPSGIGAEFALCSEYGVQGERVAVGTRVTHNPEEPGGWMISTRIWTARDIEEVPPDWLWIDIWPSDA